MPGCFASATDSGGASGDSLLLDSSNAGCFASRPAPARGAVSFRGVPRKSAAQTRTTAASITHTSEFCDFGLLGAAIGIGSPEVRQSRRLFPGSRYSRSDAAAGQGGTARIVFVEWFRIQETRRNRLTQRVDAVNPVGTGP